MSYQNISAVLPDADLQAIREAVATLNAKLPFLINLSNEERRSLFKMGPKSVDFVQGTMEAVKTFPQILPPTFNKEEFIKDAELLTKISELQTVLASLTEKVDDTNLALGSETISSALDVYTYGQTASYTQPGMKSLADKLKERFRRQGRVLSAGTPALQE